MSETVLINLTLKDLYTQVPSGTNQFFEWYFYGLGGIGGWVIFLFLAVVATAWLLYDSQRRRLPAWGWRIAAIFLTLAIVPTALYSATVAPIDYQLYQTLELYGDQCPNEVITREYPELGFTTCEQARRNLPPMTAYDEYVFYMGILGGALAPVLAIGFWITFQGMRGCAQGHVYNQTAGACPECATWEASQQMQFGYPEETAQAAPDSAVPPPRPARPKVQYAWLVDIVNERRYDLCQGTTRIGRDRDCDIVLTDPAVSRPHAQLREVSGHFAVTDLGSSSGTLLNGRALHGTQILQNGDVLTLGDTDLKFVTSL